MLAIIEAILSYAFRRIVSLRDSCTTLLRGSPVPHPTPISSATPYPSGRISTTQFKITSTNTPAFDDLNPGQHSPKIPSSSDTSSFAPSRISKTLSAINDPDLSSDTTLCSALVSVSTRLTTLVLNQYQAPSDASLPSARCWPTGTTFPSRRKLDHDLLGMGLAFEYRTHPSTEHLYQIYGHPYHLNILEEECIERSPASEPAGLQGSNATSNCAVALNEAIIELLEADDAVCIRPGPRTSWNGSSMWDRNRRSMRPRAGK